MRKISSSERWDLASSWLSSSIAASELLHIGDMAQLDRVNFGDQRKPQILQKVLPKFGRSVIGRTEYHIIGRIDALQAFFNLSSGSTKCSNVLKSSFVDYVLNFTIRRLILQISQFFLSRN